MGMNVWYKCGNMGHKQRYCPVATRLGRKRKLKESKKDQIKEGLSLDSSLLSKDRVPMSPQVYYDISSGKLWVLIAIMMSARRMGLFWCAIIDLLAIVVEYLCLMSCVSLPSHSHAFSCFSFLILLYFHDPDQGFRCDMAKEEPGGPRSSLFAISHFIGSIHMRN